MGAGAVEGVGAAAEEGGEAVPAGGRLSSGTDTSDQLACLGIVRLAPDRPKIRIVVKDNAPPRDRRNRSQALATSSGSPSDPGMGTRAGRPSVKLRASLRAGSQCTYMFIPVHTCNYVHSKVTTKPRARAGSPERRLPASSLLRQRRSRLEPSRPTACEVEHCALNARMPQVFRNQRQLLCIVQTR